jgi:phage portal protein BeeE
VGLVVTTPQGVNLTEEQAIALQERIDAKFTAEGRGRTSVMTHGATMAQMGFDPQKMDLKNLHRIPEERIAAVLGVHPMVAGLGAGLERSTFSNYEEAREALFEQTIMPLYSADAATWQKQLLRADFETNKRTHCRYDVTDVRALQDDLTQVYERLSVAVGKKPFLTRNEARAEVGFDSVDGWDEEDTEPAPVPVLPGGEEDEDDGDGEVPALPPPEERMRRLLAEERKSIGLGAFPGLLDAVQALAAPALERDLTAYFKGQGERVQKRLAR